MAYDTKLIARKLRRWDKYLTAFKLPQWNTIPNIGLYMEQVLLLLNDYLDYFPPELKDESVITAAAINNYVRTKVMPEPRKKKYYRIHIAYLIMIYTLKQSLSIRMLQRLIPLSLSEEEMRTTYESFVYRHSLATKYFIEQVKTGAGLLLQHESASEWSVTTVEELIASAAIVSGFARLLSEKLLLLDDVSLIYDTTIEEEK